MLSVNCFNRKETNIWENSEKRVFKFRLHVGGLGRFCIFLEEMTVSKSFGESMPLCDYQNNTISGSDFKF